MGRTCIPMVLLVASLLIASIPSGFLLAADPLEAYSRRRGLDGDLYSRGWSEGEVRRIDALRGAALRRVEELLGRKRGTPFLTVLAPDAAEMSRLAAAWTGSGRAGEHALGLALPRAGILILRPVPFHEEASVETVLRHELAHLVVHRRVDVEIPKWLDEGIAGWASGERIDDDADAYASLLARIGALYPLERLAYAFPRRRELESFAYLQSRLLVEYLVERWGSASVGRTLDALEAGLAIEPALRLVLGIDPGVLDSAFADWVRARHSALVSLGSVLGLWAWITALAILAMGLSWFRRRRRFAQLAALESEDPSEARDPQALEEGPDSEESRDLRTDR